MPRCDISAGPKTEKVHVSDPQFSFSLPAIERFLAFHDRISLDLDQPVGVDEALHDGVCGADVSESRRRIKGRGFFSPQWLSCWRREFPSRSAGSCSVCDAARVSYSRWGRIEADGRYLYTSEASPDFLTKPVVSEV